MKPIIALITLVSTTFLNSSSANSLTPQEARRMVETSHSSLENYYASINLLLGSQMDFTQKEMLVEELIENYFLSPKIIVFCDYDKNGVERMPIKEYLSQLASVYGDEKLGVIIGEPIILNKGVFYQGDSFITKVEVTRSITSSNKSELNSSLKIDYYFVLNRVNYEIKVYGMSKHIDNINELTPANVESKKIENKSDNSFALLTLNVKPANFKLKINDVVKYAVNDLPIQLPSGKCRIELSANGCNPKVFETYQIQPGENSLQAQLQEKVARWFFVNKGRNELDAQVFVDGRIVGNLPLESYVIKEGKHSVQVSKAGYFSKKKFITVQEGKDDKWKVDLVNVENFKTGVKVVGGVLGSFFK